MPNPYEPPLSSVDDQTEPVDERPQLGWWLVAVVIGGAVLAVDSRVDIVPNWVHIAILITIGAPIFWLSLDDE